MRKRLVKIISLLLAVLLVVSVGPMALAAEGSAQGSSRDVAFVTYSKVVTSQPAAETARVPILLYHHISADEPESDTVLNPATFTMHMQLLKTNGYEPVSFDDIIAFVESGEPLPEKPVIITFDDGYYSNYEYAFPILKEYGFCATIFIIGSSVGRDKYKDTEYEITPHFGKAEIEEMVDSGLIDIQSHTYDMHQASCYEPGAARETILPFEGESVFSYKAVLESDVIKQNLLFESLNIETSSVMAYPLGRRTVLTSSILKNIGYRATVTTNPLRINIIAKGQPNSLYDLGRLNLDNTKTSDEILAYLNAK